MKQLFQLSLSILVLSACAAGAQAQCLAQGVYEAIALIDRPHPQENLFPHGGWTLYPGEAGSGVPSCSNYSYFTGLVQPAVAAAHVLEKLGHMRIPIKPPAPQFLGRNPAIADNVDLPTPRGWLPKDDDKEEKKDKDEKNKDDKKDTEEPLEKPKTDDK
jgi:hypothetical protein